jgi:VCBS repeat-containing protein
MATLAINNAIGGLSEGSTLSVAAQQGVLATDAGPYGFPLAVSAVTVGIQTTNLSGGAATIQGAYGTLTMHADGSYSYAALNNIALHGFVQDKFTFSVTDDHGNTGQATLKVTVTQVGVQYVAGIAGQTVTIGNAPTVVDASLGNVTVKGGNGNDAVIGGGNDTITLGNGNVWVIGGTSEKVTVGNGNDTISVGATSTISAGNGNDSITAGSSSKVTVGNGNDTVTVGDNSTIIAGNGNDTLTAGANSTISAGNGNDTLSAGAGSTETTKKYGVVSPALSAPSSLSVNEDGSIALPITVTVRASAESVTVKISGIPADAALSNNSGKLAVTNGSIVLTQAQLAGLNLKAGEVVSTTLTVTAIGTLASNFASSHGMIRIPL